MCTKPSQTNLKSSQLHRYLRARQSIMASCARSSTFIAQVHAENISVRICVATSPVRTAAVGRAYARRVRVRCEPCDRSRGSWHFAYSHERRLHLGFAQHRRQRFRFGLDGQHRDSVSVQQDRAQYPPPTPLPCPLTGLTFSFAAACPSPSPPSPPAPRRAQSPTSPPFDGLMVNQRSTQGTQTIDNAASHSLTRLVHVMHLSLIKYIYPKTSTNSLHICIEHNLHARPPRAVCPGQSCPCFASKSSAHSVRLVRGKFEQA